MEAIISYLIHAFEKYKFEKEKKNHFWKVLVVGVGDPQLNLNLF
jgi:hypothetical protein